MTAIDQNKLREKAYKEALRYMDNANEALKKAQKEGKYYNDIKYVRMACGTAYSGVLLAIDAWLQLKGILTPVGNKRKSIDFYQEQVGKLDWKMLNHLNVVYKILHLNGYYDGINKVDVVKSGFEDAYAIIEKIKPKTQKAA